MADEQSQQLCTSCGLCCTGAIYDYVTLDPGEAASLRASGCETGGDQERPVLPLPCPMLRGTLCSIYNDRPARCRSFRCQVLSGLQDGEIGLAEALNHVAIAKKLTADVAAHLNPVDNLSAARRSWLAWSQQAVPRDDLDPQKARRLDLAMTALNLYLDRHFRKRHQAVLTEVEARGAPRP